MAEYTHITYRTAWYIDLQTGAEIQLSAEDKARVARALAASMQEVEARAFGVRDSATVLWPSAGDQFDRQP